MTHPSNIHGAIESDLVCWKCGAANAPGRTYVAADFRTGTAYCVTCSASGLIAWFQPKPLPEGER